jgi:hypothetical protein
VPEVTVRPPNALVLVVGGRIVDVPISMMGSVVSATRSCIAIGTTHPMDGSVLINLTTTKPNDSATAYDGLLDTPERKVAVTSVENDVYASVPVAARRSRVRIVVDDPTEPTRVDVYVG